MRFQLIWYDLDPYSNGNLACWDEHWGFPHPAGLVCVCIQGLSQCTIVSCCIMASFEVLRIQCSNSQHMTNWVQKDSDTSCSRLITKSDTTIVQQSLFVIRGDGWIRSSKHNGPGFSIRLVHNGLIHFRHWSSRARLDLGFRILIVAIAVPSSVPDSSCIRGSTRLMGYVRSLLAVSVIFNGVSD